MSITTVPLPEYLTLRSAARYSGLSIETLRRMIRNRRLLRYKPTRKVLVRRGELEELIRRSAKEP
jgi:excisionase family DNA binding protein